MRPQRIVGVSSRVLADGESVLLNQEGERALVLNPLATVVWQLADGQHTAEQISAIIAEHFGNVPGERIIQDVAQLLSELIKAGVIQDVEVS